MRCRIKYPVQEYKELWAVIYPYTGGIEFYSKKPKFDKVKECYTSPRNYVGVLYTKIEGLTFEDGPKKVKLSLKDNTLQLEIMW